MKQGLKMEKQINCYRCHKRIHTWIVTGICMSCSMTLDSLHVLRLTDIQINKVLDDRQRVADMRKELR